MKKTSQVWDMFFFRMSLLLDCSHADLIEKIPKNFSDELTLDEIDSVLAGLWADYKEKK